MFTVVTGGSGSGKSAFAEQLVLESGNQKRYYIATMECFDEETKKRIARHRQMRADKNFTTIECPRNLEQIQVDPDSTILLECMSNLTANEFFGEESQDLRSVKERILSGIECLLRTCRHLIVVTNEIFSDGITYDPETMAYLKELAQINCALAQRADQVVEVVYGIPLLKKERNE